MRSLAATSLLLGLGRAAASSCPVALMDPYMDEASPFGWPIAPSEWSFAHADCWEEKYALCAGSRQSPMAMDFQHDDASCHPQVAGLPGSLASQAAYKVAAGNPKVSVSKYMRTVMVEGDFGSLVLKDASGESQTFKATQVHLTADSMHSVNGTHAAAEMLIVHQPEGKANALEGSVVVSVMFSEGESSSLFDEMGLNAERSAGQASWSSPKSIDLKAAMSEPLTMDSYTYQGSVPVPPCSETVQWIVIPSPQTASASQISKLKDILIESAGGSAKRPPVSRAHSGTSCRPVVMNSDVYTPPAGESVCYDAQGVSKERSAACWTSSCGKSPIDVQTSSADRTLAKVSAKDLMHYKPVEHVTLKPSMYTLDATVHGGDFGYIMVNGHKFEAKKVMIKPVSAHTINGERFAGELMIEHELFGAGGADHGHAAGHRRLTEETHTEGDHSSTAGEFPDHSAHAGNETSGEPKTVIVSVPLALGAESPLLRTLEMASDAHAAAIRDGNGYDVHGPIDVGTGIDSSLAEDFYWYHGSQLHGHSCSESGVRWMVFEKPLTVSLDQLNSLHLMVSGVDSSPATSSEEMVFASAIPAHAAEAGDGSCSTDSWSYEKPSCWSAISETCASGTAQSPINVQTESVTKVGSANFLSKTSWKPISGLRAEGIEHGFGVRSQMLGYISRIDQNGYPAYYQATGFDLKMPSEHMIDGHQFAAELQVMHKKQIYTNELSDEELVVTSFMFEAPAGASDNKLLKQVMPAHPPMEGHHEVIGTPVDLMWAMGPALDGDFYMYDGSLTKPGCDETVKWVLFSQTQTMSPAQLAAFKAAYGSTNRPIQELGSREVSKNSLDEGELLDLRYFLGREEGRNRLSPDAGIIVVPIIATMILMTIVSTAMFAREDSKRKAQSAGGLETVPATTVGRSGYGRM